ncbi:MULTISPECIES: hypothetical protein [unclassified Nocardioides]|uniref:hypothetical protein n=1 Tax=unclassified Nocardioides TaxID=2615069 RepID=UPI0006F38D94|nr:MULTISPECIES: hypothetical protein [unclassified Nocardioides]KRA30028.1 hypothetical protein ASD81_20275 [Nocardioides sp. Root614]KRA86948.1 hypothetical protein ASD84_22490 [Nocardioides sp. Root682]
MESATQLVLDELKAVGFAVLAMPLQVAGAELEFEAAAIGTGVSHDLVVVATAATAHRRLVRLTEGLSRALDHAKSTRPVTVIYIGDPPVLATQDQLERNARLLLVGIDSLDAVEIRRAISVLMPLTLPAEQADGKEPIAEVLKALGSTTTVEHLNLVRAAQDGTDAVRDALQAYIDDVFDGDEDELSTQ